MGRMQWEMRGPAESAEAAETASESAVRTGQEMGKQAGTQRTFAGEAAWKQFAASGKIQDYLSYRRSGTEPEKREDSFS